MIPPAAGQAAIGGGRRHARDPVTRSDTHPYAVWANTHASNQLPTRAILSLAGVGFDPLQGFLEFVGLANVD
jgi:hypothetical protein